MPSEIIFFLREERTLWWHRAGLQPWLYLLEPPGLRQVPYPSELCAFMLNIFQKFLLHRSLQKKSENMWLCSSHTCDVRKTQLFSFTESTRKGGKPYSAGNNNNTTENSYHLLLLLQKKVHYSCNILNWAFHIKLIFISKNNISSLFYHRIKSKVVKIVFSSFRARDSVYRLHCIVWLCFSIRTQTWQQRPPCSKRNVVLWPTAHFSC